MASTMDDWQQISQAAAGLIQQPGSNVLSAFDYYSDDDNGTSVAVLGGNVSLVPAGGLNLSHMNITLDLNIHYALPLYGYIMPFLGKIFVRLLLDRQ